MDYNKQKLIFDKEAPTWDNKDIDNSESIKKLMNYLNLKEGMKVLDVGCGTGVIDKALSEAVGESGLVKAIDISSGMLSVAKEKYKNYCNIIFEENNIEIINDENEFYDAVICNNVFPHFVNPEKVLLNSYRLLKSNGIFAVSHLQGREYVNNIHRNTDNFGEDKVPVPEKWVKFFEKYNFNEKISLDQDNFYLIIMEKNKQAE